MTKYEIDCLIGSINGLVTRSTMGLFIASIVNFLIGPIDV